MYALCTTLYYCGLTSRTEERSTNWEVPYRTEQLNYLIGHPLTKSRQIEIVEKERGVLLVLMNAWGATLQVRQCFGLLCELDE